MHSLEVRVGSARGFVTVVAYRALLDDVRALLGEIDSHAGGVGRPTITWAVTHRDTANALVLRIEPFEPTAESDDRVLFAAGAVVGGVRELTTAPSIPAYYTQEAVEELGKAAGRRGTSGIDRLELAAVNGRVLDIAEVTESVRVNAAASVAPVTRSAGSVEGVVDALRGGAKGKRRATLYNTSTRRGVRVRLQEADVEDFRAAWGKRVAVRGMIDYNRLGQPISVDAEQLLILEVPAARESLREMIGIGPDWTGGRALGDVMKDLRRRA